MTRRASGQRDLLAITQWLSPAFPTGGFAYSHGLDWTIAAGNLTTGADFSAWLSDILRYGAGWNDGILVALAHRSVQPDAELSDVARALVGGAERWRETCEQGRAFVRTTNAVLDTRLAEMPLPVAVGAQARRLAVPTADLVALYLHAFASNLTSIATRIVPLGQTEAQRGLGHQTDLIADIAASCVTATLDDLAQSALRGDLAALHHETQEVRLFLT